MGGQVSVYLLLFCARARVLNISGGSRHSTQTLISCELCRVWSVELTSTEHARARAPTRQPDRTTHRGSPARTAPRDGTRPPSRPSLYCIKYSQNVTIELKRSWARGQPRAGICYQSPPRQASLPVVACGRCALRRSLTRHLVVVPLTDPSRERDERQQSGNSPPAE